MFRTFPLSIIKRFSLYTANMYDIYHYCVYSEKFLMMDRGTFRKFYSKNKVEKLVILGGFIIRTNVLDLQRVSPNC